MSLLKRSFLLSMGGLIAAAVAPAPVHAQGVFSFNPRDYGAVDLPRRQSTGDASSVVAAQGGAFEPIRALRSDDEYRKAAHSIGRVDVVLRSQDGRESGSACTGTVLHGYVLTNYHCIPGKDAGSKVVRAAITMNYLEQGDRGARRFELAVTPAESNYNLDYALVAIQGDASEFEGIRLSGTLVQPGQSLVIIHHPEGRPMVMTRFNCRAYSEQPDQNVLRHRCDTMPGSSGGMILTSGLTGVALHFEGGLQPNDERSYNSSTRMSALLGASPLLRSLLAPGGTAVAAPAPAATAADVGNSASTGGDEGLAERHRTDGGRRPPADPTARKPDRADPTDLLRSTAPR
jgi:V8-like Glu-specific endopeptidase